MRVIRVEVPAKFKSTNDEISLASDHLRDLLFDELKSMDSEIREVVRERATSYFPPDYSVFVKTHLDPQDLSTRTELWIVDPRIRWPSGLLTRSAWRLLTPMLAQIVQDAFASRLENVALTIRQKEVTIAALTPTRTWRDPVVLSIAMITISSLYWNFGHGWLKALINS